MSCYHHVVLKVALKMHLGRFSPVQGPSLLGGEVSEGYFSAESMSSGLLLGSIWHRIIQP